MGTVNEEMVAKKVAEAQEHIRQAEKRYRKKNGIYSNVIRFIFYPCITFFFCFVVVWTIFPHVTLRSMKTGFLKWRPDFDIAADEYQKAGWYFKPFFV